MLKPPKNITQLNTKFGHSIISFILNFILFKSLYIADFILFNFLYIAHFIFQISLIYHIFFFFSVNKYWL